MIYTHNYLTFRMTLFVALSEASCAPILSTRLSEEVVRVGLRNTQDPGRFLEGKPVEGIYQSSGIVMYSQGMSIIKGFFVEAINTFYNFRDVTFWNPNMGIGRLFKTCLLPSI